MSLVQVREKLKGVDRALGELQKALMLAGNELSKADSMIGLIQGESQVKRTRRRAKRAVNGGGADAQPAQAAEVVAEAVTVESRPVQKRPGRPRRKVDETGNSGDEVVVEA